MKIRFLPDNPINDIQADELGHQEFIEILRESIKYTEAPFVYGVLGDWGVGKTSILRVLESQLNSDFQEGRTAYIPIWFNAWKYENEVNMIYPLLFNIKKHYERRFSSLEADKAFFTNFIAVTEASIAVAADMVLRAATKCLVDEALTLEDVQKQVQEATERNSLNLDKVLDNWADKVSQLQEAFEELMDSYAEEIVGVSGNTQFSKDSLRFVILVDDLDRCLPETTIAVLESIKNYLTVKNCIFILGLNPNIIYQGIRIKYHGLEINGREYLEKILNYSFYVPEPELNKVSSFALGQLNKLVADENTRKKYESQFMEFGEILEECQFNNPRKIKRVLNRYLFFLRKYENSLDSYHNSNTVRLIVLAEYFPGLFLLFLKQKRMIGIIKGELEKVYTDFDIDSFEKRFGVSVKLIYPQLLRMNKLFDLNLRATSNQVEIADHIQKIFQITRLV